jgi:hypothetical protein
MRLNAWLGFPVLGILMQKGKCNWPWSRISANLLRIEFELTRLFVAHTEPYLDALSEF